MGKAQYPYEKIKYISIYYIPIHPKDEAIRNGISWSILYGCKRIRKLLGMTSRFIYPVNYYVSFPWGVFLSKQIEFYRSDIKMKKNIFISYNNRTAKDGEYLSFTFNNKDFLNMKRKFLDLENKLYMSGSYWSKEKNTLMNEVRFPKEKRYSGRFIELKELLKEIPNEEIVMRPVETFNDISSWENYCKYLGSHECKNIKKPKWRVFLS